MSKPAISPTREENFPEWYQEVISASDMAENSAVRGCMVIKPWGYGIWELIQKILDEKIKRTGCRNAYFPLFIPLSFLQKEAAHVEGFAKECAVVTHHRLESKDGQLVPASPLDEPLVVRPTSETIIGASFAQWIESWRDLPLLINQWANVVRWEMRPRLFLRTAEFLWQEGHTVHASETEARARTMQMLEVYRELMERYLLMPVIVGEKSEGERFPGAVSTFSLEAIMQDGKALQAGTSHYLGQHFAKASEIKFTDANGTLQYGYTTSWGVTTRLIGALVMTHGDDDGLRLPPRVAPTQVVILPVVPSSEHETHIFESCKNLAERLSSLVWEGALIRVEVDLRPKRGGEKNWEWIKKGAPVRIEVGPKDLEAGVVQIMLRTRSHKEKIAVPLETVGNYLQQALSGYEQQLWQEASDSHSRLITTNLSSPEELVEWFQTERGAVIGKWCGEAGTEEQLAASKATIRCLPLEQSQSKGRCLLTGRPATIDALFAKAY